MKHYRVTLTEQVTYQVTVPAHDEKHEEKDALLGGEEEICGLGYLIEDSLAYFLNLAVFVVAGRVVERITAFEMRSEDDRDALIDPRLGAMAGRVIGVKYSSLKYGYG